MSGSGGTRTFLNKSPAWRVCETAGVTDGRPLMGFEEFVRSQTRPLLGLGTAMSSDAALAEDLVQDVLLKVHGRWERIAALDDPPSYVRRMLVNEYLSWRRKWARVVPVASAEPRWELDDTPDPATTHADRAALTEQLRRLTRRQRTVL